jgi:hypothetical protein
MLWVVSFTLLPLYPGVTTPCADWMGGCGDPEPVATLWRTERYSAPAGNRGSNDSSVVNAADPQYSNSYNTPRSGRSRISPKSEETTEMVDYVWMYVRYVCSFITQQFSSAISLALSFSQEIIRWAKTTEFYHSFIQYTGSYMFRQWSTIIREHNKRNHNTPAHRPHKHTLYDIPPIRSAFQVTQTNSRISLMMADHCRNTQEPVYWIKEWYNSVNVLVVFATSNNARYEHWTNTVYSVSTDAV